MPQPALRYFDARHLPPTIRPISEAFGHLAQQLARTLPDNEQSRKALDWLLIAKDCACRSALDGRQRDDDVPPTQPGISLPNLPDV